MLVPKPMAARAVTIKNLLVPLMIPDAAAGIQPMLFKIASSRTAADTGSCGNQVA